MDRNPGEHLQVSVTGEGRMAGNHKSKLAPNQQDQEGSYVAKKSTVNGCPEKSCMRLKY